MTLGRYRILEAVVIIIVMVLVGWSVYNGQPWIPAPAIIAGFVIGLLFRKGIKRLAVDERINTVAEKALSLACGIFMILSAIVGLTLIALSRNSHPDLGPVGYTLAFSTCAITMIYYLANIYYNRKLSGKE